MPANQPLHFLISYDIADPKRLSKIHRTLKKAGIPVQYSVFSVVCTKRRVLNLLAHLENIMEGREDDLRCYTLPGRIDCTLLGKQLFPDGVLLFDKGVSCLIGQR